MNNERYSHALSFVLRSGIEVFPVRIKRRDTQTEAFRISPGGNTLLDSEEVDEAVMLKKVLEDRYAVRCASLDGRTNGLYKADGHSVAMVKRHAINA